VYLQERTYQGTSQYVVSHEMHWPIYRERDGVLTKTPASRTPATSGMSLTSARCKCGIVAVVPHSVDSGSMETPGLVRRSDDASMSGQRLFWSCICPRCHFDCRTIMLAPWFMRCLRGGVSAEKMLP
jgi:hypothetical protein